MERIPYGKYTKEFRQGAVKLVIEGGLSIHEAAIAGSISTVNKWVRACKAGKLTEAGCKQRALTEIEMEMAEVKRERDTFKKTVAYFAK